MTPEEILLKYFGHNSFRPGQREIVTSIIEGKNVLAILPTGGGKSLCFQVPALLSSRLSVVISPLIALMKDQVDSLNSTEPVAAFINSTVGFIETEEIFREITSGKVKLLYLAPEKLENSQFADRIKELEPEYLFVDEAHCISEWGHNFRPSFRRIKSFAEYTGIKKISAFTATATPEVVDDIILQLGMQEPEVFIKGFERENLSVNVIKTTKKKTECFNLINSYGTPAIVYASSRKKCEEVSDFLNLYNFNAACYHAGLAAERRKHIQEEFLSGRVDIIVATNAFGMGIDKKDIRLVIHYNMPGTIENYYQEIGRAGRDGKESNAFMLFDENDRRIHEYFIKNSYPAKELVTGVYNALCDYGKIALGGKSDKPVAVNEEYIAKYIKKDISKALLSSALSCLEEAGYIKPVSALERKYLVQFNLDVNTLKEYTKSVSNNTLRDIIVILLKKYGTGIINSMTPISPEELAANYGISPEYVFQTLELLNSLGILDLVRPSAENKVTFPKSRVRNEYLFLDYERITRNCSNATAKLEEIVRYAYATECRMKFIMNYFGQKDDNYKCCKCDNCTGGGAERYELTSNVSEYLSELILRAALEASEGMTETRLISILQGKPSKDLLDSSPVFGCCSSYSLQELKSVIESLCAQEMLEKEGSYRKKLKVSRKGREFLDERDLAPILGKEAPLMDTKEAEENLELFNKLREVRSQASRKFQQAEELICPDAVLRQLSRTRPSTFSAILGVKGFNQRMFNKVGEDFLGIIRDYITHSDNSGASTPGTSREVPKVLSETYKLLKERYPLSDIASLRKLNETVISMQVETILEMFPETDVSYLFTKEDYSRIEEEIGKGFNDLKELKSRLPENIGFPLLRIAAAKLKKKS
ncbi:MAG: RecQ family ATP-dependent DNA helicase [Ignavibacteria bacterium]|jgi:ATP-dependent DNA helicase RecQ|nr:RecQ family ATP-dependent DNA helicase [Ignavibacteria bacterium]MCU7505059.1 RecQ family ATP-dependent DNA helicase [Ignavibacteria bacterium]MCU7515301.1 RecQ family ATP-dependent DNA helicase [Ignavibacteria bacterium]